MIQKGNWWWKLVWIFISVGWWFLLPLPPPPAISDSHMGTPAVASPRVQCIITMWMFLKGAGGDVFMTGRVFTFSPKLISNHVCKMVRVITMCCRLDGGRWSCIMTGRVFTLYQNLVSNHVCEMVHNHHVVQAWRGQVEMMMYYDREGVHTFP